MGLAPRPGSIPWGLSKPRGHQTLLGKSKTRVKAVLQTMFEDQRDRVHSPGETYVHGVENGPPRLTQRSRHHAQSGLMDWSAQGRVHFIKAQPCSRPRKRREFSLTLYDIVR